MNDDGEETNYIKVVAWILL